MARWVVTAGPTREYLDRVRFISNPSSGRMGYAIAAAALARGHRVTLVSGPVALAAPAGARLVGVETVAQMRRATLAAFRRADALVMTAAVGDYAPRRAAAGKRRRADVWRIELIPTPDIVAEAGRRKGRRTVVGFALESGPGGRRRALEKMRRKKLDAVVLNGPSNLGGDRAEVEVWSRAGAALGRWKGTKTAVAANLVRLVEKMLRERGNSDDLA